MSRLLSGSVPSITADQPHQQSPPSEDSLSFGRDNGRPRVSLCLIVRNEEANLPICLRSVVGLVGEIVVVDTGSTDQTKEVAARHGAKVFDFLWQDSFAAGATRVCDTPLVTGCCTWMPMSRSTSRIVPACALCSLPCTRKTPATCCGNIRSFQAHGSAAVVDQVRLFRRHEQLRWRYRVHEQILPGLRQLGAEVRTTDVVIRHTGFAEAAVQGTKVDRNLRLLLLDHQDHPDDAFVLYNLGAVALTQGRLAEAQHWLRQSLERSPSGDPLIPRVSCLLANCLYRLGQPLEALAVCRTAGAGLPRRSGVAFLGGVVAPRPTGSDRGGTVFAATYWRHRRAPVDQFGRRLAQGYRARQLLAEVLRLQRRPAESGDTLEDGCGGLSGTGSRPAPFGRTIFGATPLA